MIFLRANAQSGPLGVQDNCYRVADQVLIADVNLPELTAYKTTPLGVDRFPPQMEWFSSLRELAMIYQGPGWIGNRWRQVTCWRHSAGYQIQVPEVGRFAIAEGENPVICVDAKPGADQELVFQTIIGPLLILALALGGVWCLHASAAFLDGRLAFFTGESGNGKSTLAAYLAESSIPAWQRVADDILPLAKGEGKLVALPHFPQLKLPTDQQPVVQTPARMRVDSVYLLKPTPAGSEITLNRLSQKQSALTLARHTVAGRLFDSRLLAKHFDFCTQAAKVVAAYELGYPHEFKCLSQVKDLLSASLSL